MSQEKVEVVRKTLARLNRGEDVRDVLSPDVVFEVHVGPEPGEYRGIEAVVDYYRRYFGTWEGFRVVIDELRGLPDGRVFVAARDTGRGKASGVDVEMNVFQVWTFDEARVVAWQGFSTRDEALEAAGLRE
jgi:ketosteroid isomerase-like protein